MTGAMRFLAGSARRIVTVLGLAATVLSAGTAHGVGGESQEAGPAYLAAFYRNEEGVVANVLDKNGNQRLLKLVMLIKVKNPEFDKQKLQDLWPEISQEVMFLLGEYKIESLFTPEAKEEFRQVLIKLLKELTKKAYKDGELVQDMLFEDFVYQ